MALAAMNKVLIASYHSVAGELLDALQNEGIMQVLDAERAMVSKTWPELHVQAKRPRDLQDTVARLEKSIVFLEAYAQEDDGTSIFEPRVRVAQQSYTEIVSSDEAMRLLDKAENIHTGIEQLNIEHENCRGAIESLLPWKNFEVPLEELSDLRTTSCIAGFIDSYRSLVGDG